MGGPAVARRSRRMDKAPRLNMNNAMRESVEMQNVVTERLGADAARRWNEERYRTLFD
jgi:hypothetical protein